MTTPSFFPPPSLEEQGRYFNEFLNQRGIDQELASSYHLRVDVANNINADYKLTKGLFYNELGIRMPYHGFGWEILPNRETTRRSNPPKDDKGKIQSKYVRWSHVRGACLYLTYREDWEVVRNNVRIPLVIVEGEFKAIEVANRLGLDYAVTGLSGNVMMVTRDVTGELRVPDLFKAFELNGRDVIMVFDADRKEETTDQTWLSLRKASVQIYQRGGRPFWINLKETEIWKSQELDKLGADDYFQNGGSIKEFWTCKKLLELECPRYFELRDEWYFCEFPQGFVNRYTGDFVKDALWNSRVQNYIDSVQTDKGIKQIQAYQQFRNAQDRPSVHGLTFKPNGEQIINGFYNSWRGWPEWADETDKGAVEDFALGMHTLCGPEEGDRVLDFMAHTFQHPNKRPQHAFLLKSSFTGTGKSTMCRVFTEVAGVYGRKVSGHEFYSQFNAWAKDRLVVWLDEIKSSDMTTNQTTEKLNDFITMPNISIEHKGVDAYSVPFFARLIMASNDPAPVHMTKMERRINVIGCKDCRGDSAHLLRMQRLNNLTEEGLQAILDWLMDRDISQYDPTARAVINEHTEEIMELSRTSAEEFADMFIEECQILAEGKDGIFYKIQDAQNWCYNRGYRGSSGLLGKAISDNAVTLGFMHQCSSHEEQIQIKENGHVSKGRWLSFTGRMWNGNPDRAVFSLVPKVG